MANISNFLQQNILKHLLRTGSYTKPSTIAVALCTSSPTQSGTLNEVANSGGYARVNVGQGDSVWTDPTTTGDSDNASSITFPTATASWGTVTHMALLDSATYGSGNLLVYSALTNSVVVGIGITPQFNVGDLDVISA